MWCSSWLGFDDDDAADVPDGGMAFPLRNSPLGRARGKGLVVSFRMRAPGDVWPGWRMWSVVVGWQAQGWVGRQVGVGEGGVHRGGWSGMGGWP